MKALGCARGIFRISFAVATTLLAAFAAYKGLAEVHGPLVAVLAAAAVLVVLGFFTVKLAMCLSNERSE